MVDPFLSENPRSDLDVGDISCQIVCVTHSHPDHLDDAFQIAKNNKAPVVSSYEISELATSKELRAEAINIGGSVDVEDWRIKMVPALHSSEIGPPSGFILKNKRLKKTLYHAGDTGLFGDMRLIGDEGIDIAMLPIGDRYTMGIEDALRAVSFIRPGLIIPMHYGTRPVIDADPEEFRKRCNRPVEIFKIGEERIL